MSHLESSVSVNYSASLAVTLTEAKSHLRVTSSAEDSIIGIYLAAAQRYVEEWCQICLIGGTVTQIWPGPWPCGYLSLSVGNVSGVTSFSYNTEDSLTFVTIDAAEYIYSKDYNRARIARWTGSWPNVTPLQLKVVYTSGFEDAADVPANIKVAILLVLADMYENRQDSIKTMPTAAQHILQPYVTIQKV